MFASLKHFILVPSVGYDFQASVSLGFRSSSLMCLNNMALALAIPPQFVPDSVPDFDVMNVKSDLARFFDS